MSRVSLFISIILLGSIEPCSAFSAYHACPVLELAEGSSRYARSSLRRTPGHKVFGVGSYLSFLGPSLTPILQCVCRDMAERIDAYLLPSCHSVSREVSRVQVMRFHVLQIF